MKRLIAGVTVLVVTAVGAPWASAQSPGPQVMGRSGQPHALEGAFQAGSGQLAFLALAAPQDCIDGSSATDCPFPLRVYFYDQSCTRVNSVPTPLTENGVALLAIHALTSATAGNFLATSSASTSSPAIRIDDYNDNLVAGTLFQVDLNRGIAWSEPLAAMHYRGWSPYRPAAVAPFLPPDAGALLVALRFRCPTGTALVHPTSTGGDPGQGSSRRGLIFGSLGTLGGDMWEAMNQLQGGDPGLAYSRESVDSSYQGAEDFCRTCRGAFSSDATAAGGTISGFATALTFFVFDTNENPIGVVSNVSCSCLSEFRWSTLFPDAATESTYVEIFGTAPPNFNGSIGGLFAGSWRIQITTAGLNLLVSRRFHVTNAAAFLVDLNP